MKFQEIIAGCIQQNRHCQRQLYDHCYHYGLKVTLAYSKDFEEAREILNDSYLKMYAQLESYDAGRPFLPWFRTIIIRTAINHYRKNNNEFKGISISQMDENSLQEDATVISDLEANDLMKLTQQLPSAYKLVLNLYALEGYTHSEIAKMLGISEGTSKSNLHKARAFLSKLINSCKILL